MPQFKSKPREQRLRFIGPGKPRIIQPGESVIDPQDAQIQAMINNAIAQSSYLPLSGGTLSGALTLNNVNVILGTGAGTKIGTAASQKLGFFNATPIIQPATTGGATGYTGAGGTALTHTDTFTGNSGTKAYTINDIVKALKDLGLLAAS